MKRKKRERREPTDFAIRSNSDAIVHHFDQCLWAYQIEIRITFRGHSVSLPAFLLYRQQNKSSMLNSFDSFWDSNFIISLYYEYSFIIHSLIHSLIQKQTNIHSTQPHWLPSATSKITKFHKHWIFYLNCHGGGVINFRIHAIQLMESSDFIYENGKQNDNNFTILACTGRRSDKICPARTSALKLMLWFEQQSTNGWTLRSAPQVQM